MSHRIAVQNGEPGKNLRTGREILEGRLEPVDGLVAIGRAGQARTGIDFKGSQTLREGRRIDLERLRMSHPDAQSDQVPQGRRRGIHLGLNGRDIEISEFV